MRQRPAADQAADQAAGSKPDAADELGLLAALPRPRRLMAEAVAMLARRDLSRQTLRERLLAKPWPGEPSEAAPAVDAVLERLSAMGYLDDARLARVRATSRSARLGLRRIQHDLAQQGVQLDVATTDALKATEAERAQALWQRRFGAAPADPREHARQARFLVARGFGADLVWRIVGAVPRSAARLEGGERDGDPSDDPSDDPTGEPSTE